MEEFKIGDKVWVSIRAPMHACKKATIYRLPNRLFPEYSLTIEGEGPNYLYFLSDTYLTLLPAEAKEETKFKVGDMVRVSREEHYHHGESGAIVDIDLSYYKNLYAMLYLGATWWYTAEVLALLPSEAKEEPKFKVGDMVRVDAPGMYWNGYKATIIDITPSLMITVTFGGGSVCAYDYKYLTLRSAKDTEEDAEIFERMLAPPAKPQKKGYESSEMDLDAYNEAMKGL